MAAEDLLTAYMGTNYSHLFADAEQRPEHYGELGAEVERLRQGAEITKAARSALLVRYTEPTAKSSATKEAIRKVTAPPIEKPPVFEEQDVGPTIKFA